jgi:uncharacterized protein
MRSSPFWLVLIGMMILLDFYVFQAVKVVTHSAEPKTKTVVFVLYWALSIIVLLAFLVVPYLNFDHFPKNFRSVLFALLVAVFFGKLITSVFLVVDDARRGVQWVAGKVRSTLPATEVASDSDKMSRSLFLSWLGMVAGGGLVGSLIYGFTNKYNYQVKRQTLRFKNLPSAFKGLKIVQISDIHSGSFNNKAGVQQGVEKILKLKPDLILFTGDLVNNKADEMDEYIDVFRQLKAPLGIYSILGNHDYGDYVQWESREHKIQNLNRLKEVHAQMGWRLLLNENVLLEREGHKIAILGIENWGAKANFPKYGKMEHAYPGSEEAPFKILMSHDPSHWDAEVLPKYRDIDLMLSGHTHGMQFGVEIPWLRWSPVQYVYKQWAGLYETGHQKLYVNRGFGFLGYPGRVGILPEISLLELTT